MPETGLYRLHDFRGGHAEDLFVSGVPAAVILRMGGWRSRAFLDYLRKEEVEARAVLDVALCESESEGSCADSDED